VWVGTAFDSLSDKLSNFLRKFNFLERKSEKTNGEFVKIDPFKTNIESIIALFLILSGSAMGALLGFDAAHNFMNSYGFRYGRKIGQFSNAASGVRIRMSGSMTWRSVPTSKLLSLFEGDGIHTSEESFAHIGLNDGGEITVSPNSVVFFNQVVKNKRSQQVINVQSGGIKLDPQRNAKDLLIESKGKTFELKVPESIAKSKNLIEIQVQPESSRPEITIIDNAPKIEVGVKAIQTAPSNKLPDSIQLALAEVQTPDAPEVNPERPSSDSVVRFERTQIDQLATKVVVSEKVEVALPSSVETIQMKDLVQEKHSTIAKGEVIPQQETLMNMVPSESMPVAKVRSPASELSLARKIQDPILTPASTPEPIPDLTVDEAKKQEEFPKNMETRIGESSDFLFSFQSGYYRLKGVQNSNQSYGYLGSTSQLGLNLAWNLNFNDRYSAIFESSLNKIELTDLKSQSLQDKSQSLTSFSFGMKRSSSNFWLGILLGGEQHLAYRFLDPNTIKVDHLSVIHSELRSGWDFYQGSNVHGMLFGAVDWYLPIENDAYSLRAGYGFKFGLKLRQQFQNLGIFAEPYYRYSHLPADSYYFDESSLGLYFGLSLRLGTNK
jgi:hypothetical protein